MYTTTTMTTLLLTLLTITTTALPTDPSSSTPPAFTCNTTDIQTTHCLGPKDCLYPDPGMCNNYIHCAPADDSYTTGIAYVMPCPSGLLWNDNQKWCDWPEHTTCDLTAVEY